jgi:hypothetical protein
LVDVNSLDVGTSTLTGTALINTTGDITNSGPITVQLTTMVDSHGGNIALTQAQNDFVGAVTIISNALDINDTTHLLIESFTSTQVNTTADDGVTLINFINAAAGTIRVQANVDSTGNDDLLMLPDSTIVTTNDTALAVMLEINSLMGGAGNATIMTIFAGDTSGPNGGRVTISANAGAIIDGNDTTGVANNITVGNTILTGMSGVGSSPNPIETTVHRVEGAGGTGGFFLDNDGSLQIGGIDINQVGISALAGGNQGGEIRVLARSPLTVEENVIADNNIQLRSVDSAGIGDDLVVNAGVTVKSNIGDVFIYGGDDITLTATSLICATIGTIHIESDYEDADPNTGTTQTIASQLVSTGTFVMGGTQDDFFDFFYPLGVINLGLVTISDPGGTADFVVINGSAASDRLILTTTEPPTEDIYELMSRGTFPAEQVLIPDEIEEVTIAGGAGADTINLQPSRLWPIFIDGQSPRFGEPGVPLGDVVELDSLGNLVTIDRKTVLVDSETNVPYTPIQFDGIEGVDLLGLSLDAPQRYDLNSTTGNGAGRVQSPTQPGYTGVTADTVYSAATGYGWDRPMGAARLDITNGATAALVNDAHVAHPSSNVETRTFTADVANGWVLVTVDIGGGGQRVNGLQIEDADDGRILAQDLSVGSNSVIAVSFHVLVKDGTLDLRFRVPYGPSRAIAVSGIDIRPAHLTSMGIQRPGVLSADGTTVDTFRLYEAPPNSLITVETTLGTLIGTDADSTVLGFQVTSDAQGQADIRVRRPSAAGQGAIFFSTVYGEKTGVQLIDYGQVNSYQFDLNTPTSATFSPFDPVTNPAGWLGVSSNDLFAADIGYGWLQSPESFELASPTGNALLDDGNRNSAPKTFRTILDNASYDVTVTLGGPGAQTGTSVVANGATVVDNVQVNRNASLQQTFTVDVTSGRLDLRFSHDGSTSFGTHWEANAISIIPSATLTGTVTPGANVGSLPADGRSSVSLSFNTTAPDGTLFTVSTTLGTITSADADPSVEGIQVASSGGMITFTLNAPTLSGTPVYTLSSVDGQYRGTISDPTFSTFTSEAVRRFDFNNGSRTGSTSATAAGFTGVSRDHQSPAVDGFGYGENNLVGFVTFTGDIPGATNDDLFRDGHQNGHTTSTFLVQADAATNYDLRVYLGHQFLTRDNIEVTVEGADTATQTATTTSESGPRFTNLTFTNADDTNMDGFITLSIVDRGGRNFGYSINGLDVATAGNLPGAETLMAGGTNVATVARRWINGEENHALASVATSSFPVDSITTTELTSVINVATSAFGQLDLTAQQAKTLATASFVIADLSGGVLAEYLGGTVYIDNDATGAGWSTNLETPQPGKFDLLTAVAHELGHALELDHSDSIGDLMSDSLNTGQRNDSLGNIDNFFGELSGVIPFE